MDYLQDNEQFVVGNAAEEQSAKPSFLMDKLLSLGIKSFMVIPIRDRETMRGILVLSKVLGCHNWNNTHIHTAKQFAEVFLGAYKRMCREKHLLKMNQKHSVLVHEGAKHADILQKVARSAQMFFDTTSQNLDEVFNTVCEEIAETLQIQSISLTRYNKDFTKTCIVLDWASSRRLSKRLGSTLNHHENTMLKIPVLYHEAVWGCLLVNCASEKPYDVYKDTLELMAQYCVRAYMQTYPARQNCFSTEPEKSRHMALSLKTQPAAI
jgi:GAF domain-containing protein